MIRVVILVWLRFAGLLAHSLTGFESAGFFEHEWKSTVEFANGLYRLSWRPTEHKVVFLAEVKTQGYFGLGFSLDGRMAKADIAVGWVNDVTQKAYLIDCHGDTSNAMPIRDKVQNFELLNGYQNITHTVLVFSRLWDTCDRQEDIVIGNDTIKLIWAFHDSDDPMDESLYYIRWHEKTNRGSKSVHLKNPLFKKPNKKFSQFDMALNNINIPDNMATAYWCKIFKISRMTEKHHIIGYKPILDTRNANLIHHMILYECSVKPSFRMDEYVSQSGFMCYTAKMPTEAESCVTPIVAWAVGSEGEYLPEHVGYPVGEDPREDKYYMLEIHYDNPSLKKVIDSSGVRLLYTEKLRKHDGGIFASGIVVSPLHVIPPFQTNYKTGGYCDKYSTNAVLPPSGINTISVVLHAHSASRKIKLRHFRQGEELPPIVQDQNYDFNYQQSRALTREVTIFPGDELVTECTYNTVNRTQPTQGGLSTKQEMCLAYISYYPKVPLATCQSMNPVQFFFHTFGVKQFYNYDMETVEKIFLKLTDKEIKKRVSKTTTPKFPVLKPGFEMDEKTNEAAVSVLKQMADFTVDEPDEENYFQDLVILEPLEFRNKTFSQHLEDMPWRETLLTQRIEESFYYGKHMTFCRLSNDSLALPASVHIFPNIKQYKVPSEENVEECQSNIKKIQSNASSKIILRFNLYLVLFTRLIL